MIARTQPRPLPNMLNWTLLFLLTALIAAVLGFSGIAGTAAAIAKICFVIFLVFFVAGLVTRGDGNGRRRS